MKCKSELSGMPKLEIIFNNTHNSEQTKNVIEDTCNQV